MEYYAAIKKNSFESILMKQAIFEGWGQVAFASPFSILSIGFHV